MKNKILCLIFLILPILVKSQTTQFNFVNRPLTSAELNSPGRGAEYWNGEWWDDVNGITVPQGTASGHNGYIRFNWYDMEKAQGQYTFTGPWPSIESWIKILIERGESFSFGIMSVCDGCDAAMDGGRSAYPPYLHTLMQSEATTSKDWKSSGGTWIPNWNSPNYLSRFEALLDTLSKFINTKSYTPTIGPNAGKTIQYKNVIYYVDVRGYGNYGEWHNFPYWQETPTGRVATVASLRRIIDAHKTYFPKYPLVALMGAFDGGNGSEVPSEIGHYLFTTSNQYGKIGWRRDNLGEMFYDDVLANSPYSFNGYRFDTAFTNRWKYAIVSGEPINGGGQYANGGPPYFDLRREINLYRFAHFGNGNYPTNDPTVASIRDTLREAFKLTGYRFNLNGGSVTNPIPQNSNFTIKLNWRNVGTTPLYQKRWKVVYELRNQSNQTVKKFTSKFNPYLYLPDIKDSVVVDQFNLGNLSTGNYNLVLYIEDTTAYHKPIFLNISSPTRNTDGSYTLANISVVSASLPVIFNSFSVNETFPKFK